MGEKAKRTYDGPSARVRNKTITDWGKKRLTGKSMHSLGGAKKLFEESVIKTRFEGKRWANEQCNSRQKKAAQGEYVNKRIEQSMLKDEWGERLRGR